MRYTVVIKLSGPLAEAAAVEWSDQDAPEAGGAGWQPCIRLEDGGWRLSSHDLENPVHWREPGLFADLAIRYRLSAEGPWSPISVDRKAITIVAEEPEQPEQPEPPVPVAPVLLAAPAIAGPGTIGTEVTVDPGLWGGDPAEIALQWLRDGAEIAEATAALYVPGPADDRTELACAVTASNAGGSERALTAALAVKYAPPEVTGELFDEVFDEGSGPQEVEAAPAFSGEDLSYSVEGAGAAIDARTGTVTIPTEAPISGETVTVTASNSGGAVSAGFQVTVEALEEAPVIDAGNAELVFARDLDPEQTGLHVGLRITSAAHPMHPAQGAKGYLAWRHDGMGEPINPATQGNKGVRAKGFFDSGHPNYGVWALTRRVNGGTVAWSDRSDQIGEVHSYVINWSPGPETEPYGAVPWAGWGEAFAPLTITDPTPTQAEPPAPPPPPPPPPSAGASRRTPIRNQTEANLAGYIGGDGMQAMTGAAQCKAHPNRIYMWQDMGSMWSSYDHGRSWWKPRCKGLRTQLMNGGGVDQVDPNHVYAVAHGGWNSSAQGLYRSLDAGQNWVRVFQYTGVAARVRCDNVAGTTTQSGRQKRWVAIVNECHGDVMGTHIWFLFSDNFGELGSWAERPKLTEAQFGTVRHVQFHPTNSNTIYVAASKGLFRITNVHTSSPSIAQVRADDLHRIAFLDVISGSVHIIVGNHNGVWRSTNDGGSWSQIGTGTDVNSHRIVMCNPWNWQHIMAFGNTSVNLPRLTVNGGSSWVEPPQSQWANRPGTSGNVFPARHRMTWAWFTPTNGECFFMSRVFNTTDCFYRTANFHQGANSTWTISMDYFSGQQSEVKIATGQQFRSDQLYALGSTDTGMFLAREGGRYVSYSNINPANLENLDHRTCLSLAIHPDWPTKPNILASMNRKSSGVMIGCFNTSLNNWVQPQPSNFLSRRNCPFIGFDRSNPQWAYWCEIRSNNHGEPGSWSRMTALPDGFDVWGMTRSASISGGQGQALFAYNHRGGRDRILRSINRGDSWTEVLSGTASSLGARMDNPGLAASGPFFVHPTNHNIVFLRGDASGARADEMLIVNLASGTPGNRIANAQVRRVTNGIPPSDFAPGAQFYIGYFTVDYRFPDTVWYAGNNNVGTGVSLVRTTDGGHTWQNLSHLVPDNGMGWMDCNPFTGVLHYSTMTGIFAVAPHDDPKHSKIAHHPHPARVLGNA